jgi:cytochrome c553
MKKSANIGTLLAAGLLAGAATVRADETKDLWTQHCVSCHGKDGKGDTKAGKKANVKDLTDATYQATLTDDKMFDQIKNGMKQGNKEIMKGYGDKLSDAQIKDLVAHVRTLKK